MPKSERDNKYASTTWSIFLQIISKLPNSLAPPRVVEKTTS
jgi:hypothetical protein